MRDHNPIENTGIVRRGADGLFLGTCSLFRHLDTVMTAAHVVASGEANDLLVEFPGSRAQGKQFAVRSALVHPSADLAFLTIQEPPEREITWINSMIAESDRGLGMPVKTYGFPVEAGQPTPRMLIGYVQREFVYSVQRPYSYVAFELDFACPQGLSGAPMTLPESSGRIIGVVTGSRHEEAVLAQVVEVNDGGSEYRERTSRIIQYGIAVALAAYVPWVDLHIPPPDQDEILRRSRNQHAWRGC